MVDTIKVASYNLKGLSSSKSELCNLCRSHSLVCVQEHWLFPNDMSLLNDVHSDFRGIGVSAMDPTEGIITGRPYGGVGILWDKQIDSIISILETGENWMTCVSLKIQDSKLFIISVYLPYEKNDNSEEFVNCLAKLESFIAECDSSSVYELGDFNTDITRNSFFSRELDNYIERTSCILSDHVFIKDGFTYVSDAWGTTSWLDHCLATEDAHRAITNIDILYDYIASDHKPVTVNIRVKDLPLHICESVTDTECKVNWDRVTSEMLATYKYNSEILLGDIVENSPICTNVGICDVNCKDSTHMVAIDKLYNDIIQALRNSSKFVLDKSNTVRKHVIPGWNEHVKDAHEAARSAFCMWRRLGKPRTGSVYEIMKRSRAVFKHVLRFCKQQEKKTKMNRLAESLFNNNQVTFWKEVRKQQNNKVVLSNCIDGASGSKNIVEMWHEYYDGILNSIIYSEEDILFINESLGHASPDEGIDVSINEIDNAIKNLQNGKACGKDLINAEHLKYAHPSYYIYFLACLS